MHRRAALAWLLLVTSTSAGCTGITVEDTTQHSQDVNTLAEYQISATIVPQFSVRPDSVHGFVVIGTQTFPMIRGDSNTWSYAYHAVPCERGVRYTVIGRFSRPNIFVKPGPITLPEDSFTIRRPEQVLWDSDKKVSGAAQISLLIDLSSDATSQKDAADAMVFLYNPQPTAVTLTGVSVVSVPASALGGGRRDVRSFEVQDLPALPAAIACDETLEFGVHFRQSRASRSAKLHIRLDGAPDIDVGLFGKAFF